MRHLSSSMRRVAPILLLALASCAESHAGRRSPRRDGGPNAAQQDEETDADSAEVPDAETDVADGRAHLDATQEDRPSRMEPRPEHASTGVVGPIARSGGTLRAVRVDSAMIKVRLHTHPMCGELPADAGTSLFVEVVHASCEQLGPLEIDRSDPNAVRLIAWLWRSDGPCDTQGLVGSRTLKVGRGWSAGSYTFAQSPAGEPQVLAIAAPTAQCEGTTGGGCRHDCDCDEGQTCIYGRSSTLDCAQSCQTVCDNALGCQYPAATAWCTTDINCATGQQCMDGRCRWTVTLGQDNRHPCTRHSDCDAGLLCVEGTDGRLGCEVPCNTESMLCPGWHYCRRDANHSKARWVCEWGGE